MDWKARAESAVARITAALALCDRWEATDGDAMSITAVRATLEEQDGPCSYCDGRGEQWVGPADYDWAPCEACNARAALREPVGEHQPEPCTTCGGTGTITVPDHSDECYRWQECVGDCPVAIPAPCPSCVPPTTESEQR